MKRILSKYGAYTSHIASLSTDPSVKPADRAKLKGYYHKWTNAKYLLGCAFYVDLLQGWSSLHISGQAFSMEKYAHCVAKTRGVWGHAPQKILKICTS